MIQTITLLFLLHHKILVYMIEFYGLYTQRPFPSHKKMPPTMILLFKAVRISFIALQLITFFIDPSRKHSIKPIANGISDHDAQIIVLENVLMPAHKLTPCVFRDFNDHSIYNFLMHISMEN